MKGCLKSPLPSPCIARKCVAFCEEGSEEVHLADEWDRTPMEPARKLSYFDFLELKEIQRSLPKANQIRDPSRKPVPEYLSKVPVGLLPLLPDSPTVDSAASSAPPSPQSPTFTLSAPPSRPSQTQQPSTPPPPPPPPPPPLRTYLTHLTAAAPAPRRAKPNFTFLPLLDTSTTCQPPSAPFSSPTDSHDDELHDPPTPSLSFDSPSSRASSASPDHLANLQPESTRNSYLPSFSNTHTDHSDGIPPQHLPQDSLNPHTLVPSPLSLYATTAVTEASTTGPIQTHTEVDDSTQGNGPQDLSSRLQDISADNLNVEALDEAVHPPPSSPDVPLPIPTLTISHPPSSPGPKSPSEQKRASPFSLERECDQTCSPSQKSSGDIRRSSARICARDLRPPSPIMGPYCIARRRRASPCPSSAMMSSPWCG